MSLCPANPVIMDPLPQLSRHMAPNILSNVAVLAACDLPRRDISSVVADFSVLLQCFFHLVAGVRESYVTTPGPDRHAGSARRQQRN